MISIVTRLAITHLDPVVKTSLKENAADSVKRRRPHTDAACCHGHAEIMWDVDAEMLSHADRSFDWQKVQFLRPCVSRQV